MKVLVAGSSGFVGSALVEALEQRGDEVFRLVRNGEIGPNEVGWDPSAHSASIDMDGINGFDAIVHLGGVGIGERRWTEGHKERLWDSRVVSTELLSKAMASIDGKPATFVCASAIGFYGSRGDELLNEDASKGEGFLAELCNAWELMANKASEVGIRVANLRSGIVLGHGGGVLRQQLPLFRLGMGGVMGNGQHFISWISLQDEVRAILHVIDNDSISGPVNLVAPNPERNRIYTKILGHMLSRPTIVPVARWMMTIPLGQQFTDEVLLASQRGVPEVLQESGFEFDHTHLEQAMQAFLEDEASERNKKKDSQ